MKQKDVVKIGMYATQAAKILTATQRERLPENVKDMIIKKYNIMQEKMKL